MKSIILFLAVVLSVVSASAFADDFYARIDVGGAYMIDATATGTQGVPAGKTLKIWTEDQYALLADVGFGYYLNEYLRVEAMYAYLPNQRHSSTGYMNPVTDATGFVVIDSQALFANLYLDTDSFLGLSDWNPYLGIGLGWAWHETDYVAETDAHHYIASGENDGLAWQLLAGVQYDLTEHLGLDFMYRYINLGEGQSDKEVYNRATGAFDHDLMEPVSVSIKGHAATLGLYYSF